MEISLNVSHAYLNKELKPGFNRSAYGYSFKRATLTLEQITAHIASGCAFTLGYFANDHRHEDDWQESQLLGVDLDNKSGKQPSAAAIAKIPFVRDYAYYVYPTPSSTPEKPKTRVLFVLDTVVTSRGAWLAIQWAIIKYFKDLGLEPDENCKDLPRYFAGSTQPGHIRVGQVLPLAIAGGLTADDARRDYQAEQLRQQEPPQRKISVTSDEAERITTAYTNKVISTLSATTNDRHAALIKAAASLGDLVKGDGWTLTNGEAERLLMDACRSNGYIAKVGESEVQRTITNGLTMAAGKDLVERPKTGQNSAKSAPAPQPHTVATQHAALSHSGVITADFVGDVLTSDEIQKHRTLLIAAQTGMGKTTALVAYVKILADTVRVTGVVAWRLLTVQLAIALEAAHYEDLAGRDQRLLKSANRLVTSLSSAHKFQRVGGVVIADEIEADLQFIVNSDTFRGGDGVEAYRTFKQTVTSAEQFIGMDANLSDITKDVVTRWRGDATVKHFAKKQKRGVVTFLRDKFAALEQVQKLLGQGKQVYVACTSERTASYAAEYLKGDNLKVMKVTRDTSGTPVVESFVQDAATRAEYDLVIYDAAMGSGVDISEPVDALVGIFDRVPLDPEHAIQLFGRVRNAKRYYVAAPPESEGYETPTTEQILSDRLKREYWTAQSTGRAAQTTGDYLEMLHIWARFEERRRREMARWRCYFISRLNANGYDIQTHDAKASQPFVEAFKAWLAERHENDWQFVLEAVGTALDDRAVEKIRISGEEITHELKLRNLRDKIEKALGHNGVTENDRDLMTSNGRGALYRLADIFAEKSAIVETDNEQAAEGVPLQKRTYRTLARGTFSHLMKLVGFTGTAESQFTAFSDYFRAEHTAADVQARFGAFVSDECIKMFKSMGHHGTNALTVTGLCRWLLQHFGVDISSRQIGRGDNRQRAYQIADIAALDYVISRARVSAVRRAKPITPIILDATEQVSESQALFDALPSLFKKPMPYVKGVNPNPFSKTPMREVTAA